MAELLDARETRRFLRSLRVATQTALAGYDLSRSRAAEGGASFLALAAKGPGEFRFPEAGIVSSDGLLRATLERDAAGGAVLTLQAEGATGLKAYAARGARLRLGLGLDFDSSFDRNGTLRLGLDRDETHAANFSRFDLELLGPSR